MSVSVSESGGNYFVYPGKYSAEEEGRTQIMSDFIEIRFKKTNTAALGGKVASLTSNLFT